MRATDADGLGFVPGARVADEDVVVAVRQRHSRLVPDRDVLRPQALLESLEADDGVAAPGGIVIEGIGATGRVAAPGGVAVQRLEAEGSVVAARGVGEECQGSAGGIVQAARVGVERPKSMSGVVAPLGVVGECLESAARVVVGADVGEEREGADGGVVVARLVIRQCITADTGVVAPSGGEEERLVSERRVAESPAGPETTSSSASAPPAVVKFASPTVGSQPGELQDVKRPTGRDLQHEGGSGNYRDETNDSVQWILHAPEARQGQVKVKKGSTASPTEARQ